jgi:hypothetical protein
MNPSPAAVSTETAPAAAAVTVAASPKKKIRIGRWLLIAFAVFVANSIVRYATPSLSEALHDEIAADASFTSVYGKPQRLIIGGSFGAMFSGLSGNTSWGFMTTRSTCDVQVQTQTHEAVFVKVDATWAAGFWWIDVSAATTKPPSGDAAPKFSLKVQ